MCNSVFFNFNRFLCSGYFLCIMYIDRFVSRLWLLYSKYFCYYTFYATSVFFFFFCVYKKWNHSRCLDMLKVMEISVCSEKCKRQETISYQISLKILEKIITFHSPLEHLFKWFKIFKNEKKIELRTTLNYFPFENCISSSKDWKRFQALIFSKYSFYVAKGKPHDWLQLFYM